MRAATQLLTGKGDERFSSFAETIMIEGMQLPEHLHLKSGVFEQGLLKPEEGEGGFLTMDDVGKPNILISTRSRKTTRTATARPRRWAKRF